MWREYMSKVKFACITVLILAGILGGIVAGFLMSGAQVKVNTNTEIHIGAPTPIFQIFEVREKPKA